MTKPRQNFTPDTAYQAAMWASFALFLLAVVALATAVFAESGFRAFCGCLVLVVGFGFGAMLSQQMHLSNRVPPVETMHAPDPSEDLFIND